jgi:hypothetical protein
MFASSMGILAIGHSGLSRYGVARHLLRPRSRGGCWNQFDFVELTLTAETAITWTAHVAFVMDPALQMPFRVFSEQTASWTSSP